MVISGFALGGIPKVRSTVDEWVEFNVRREAGRIKAEKFLAREER